MEMILLGLLFLSGMRGSSGLLPQYFYVADPKTWTEAQTYCRQKYTDLAKIKNREEVDLFLSAVPPDQGSLVWIGVYSDIEWIWSDQYTGPGADFRAWENILENEPDFHSGNQFCTTVMDSPRWFDHHCIDTLSFYCYNGTDQDQDFVYVNENLTWSDAQVYCRKNFINLARIMSESENQKIGNLHPTADRKWIGLYRKPNIYWSDGSKATYTNWYEGSNPLGDMKMVCGAADRGNLGKWRALSCESQYPFVCHKIDHGTRKQVIKLRIRSSVDLNDQAVKVNLLKKLQNRLEEDGSTGVTLRWTEWPDGKVFQKDEKSHKKVAENCETIKISFD